VHAAALHPEVARVVERARGLAQVLLEHVLAVEAVDADHLHALVDAVEEHLGALDLAHRADQPAVVVVLVEVAAIRRALFTVNQGGPSTKATSST
jgi:hypothetical protein